MDAMAGRYATIAHHLINNVYLLIGLSLDDPNLRHLLRSNAISSPGRIHFIIRHVDVEHHPEKLSQAERGIADAGFELHNLYTLYLTSDETAALGRLIGMEDYAFVELARRAGVGSKLVFYLSGIPGIGKTTVLSHMGGLVALDEWREEPTSCSYAPTIPLATRSGTHLTAGSSVSSD